MNTKSYVAGSILFLALLACVGQPAVPPTHALPTIIALTANAAMTQTAIAAPPIPTATMQGLSATTIEQLSEGGTKYIDIEIGVEVVFPTGWITLRPQSKEFASALAKEAVANEMLRSQMELDVQDYEPGIDRLYSYPLRPDIEKNYAFGFSKLAWDPNDPTSISENSMGEFVRDFESSGSIPGLRVDTAQVYENRNQVKLIEVGGQFSFTNSQGDVIPFYITAVFLKPTRVSTIRITLVYLKDYKDPLYGDVKSMIDSIKILSQ